MSEKNLDQLADHCDLNQSKSSIWNLKPWWCQPWSILLTGLIVIALSWWVLHMPVLTVLVALAVIAWWMLFLVFVPAMDRQVDP